MNNNEFMAHIITEICNYAVKNKMEPNDTLRTIAANIETMLKIGSFNNWQPTNVAAQEEKKSGWISVEDRLPATETDVLAFLNDGIETRIAACNFARGVWYDCVMNCTVVMQHVTHWMPLPKPPIEI